MTKRRKRAERFVCFADEAPRLGSGWRGINVLKVGRKWVSVERHADGKRARLSRTVWDTLLTARANVGETPC